MTLIEILISIGILAFLGVFIANLFKSSIEIRRELAERSSTMRKLHIAMERITEDLNHAIIFRDTKKNAKSRTTKSGFIAKEEGEFTRLDFVTNSKVRFFAGAHESDLAEIGYFVETDKSLGKTKSLYRRESSVLYESFTKGGMVLKLLDHVATFKLRFNNGKDKDYTQTSWDTTKSDQKGTLPLAVDIHLGIYKGVESEDDDLSTKAVEHFHTRVYIEMANAL